MEIKTKRELDKEFKEIGLYYKQVFKNCINNEQWKQVYAKRKLDYKNYNDTQWVRVDDIINYLKKERKWYQNEYNHLTPDADEYMQRFYEIRLLNRLIDELSQSIKEE